MSEENKGMDLSSAISQHAPEAPAAEQQQDDAALLIAQVEQYMNQLNDSVASMHIAVRTLSNRVASLEKHVSYLLEQDPIAGPKIKAHLAELDKKAGASNEQGKVDAGTEAKSGQ